MQTGDSNWCTGLQVCERCFLNSGAGAMEAKALPVLDRCAKHFAAQLISGSMIVGPKLNVSGLNCRVGRSAEFRKFLTLMRLQCLVATDNVPVRLRAALPGDTSICFVKSAGDDRSVQN